MLTAFDPRPYRVIVFAKGFQRGRLHRGRGPQHKGAHTAIEPSGYAFVAWNPDHSVEAGRLAGSGSFVWLGLHAARAAAVRALEGPGVESVSVRTNQDRPVYRFLKRANGGVTGYGYTDEGRA